MKPLIIITHRDLDGIAGAAAYVYCRGLADNAYKVVFIEPNKFLRMLRRYYKKDVKYVIIDIGLNDEIFQELKHMNLGNVHIEWYDHHVWENEWIEVLKTKNVEVYVDRGSCATGVVARHACGNRLNNISDFVESICGADLWRFNRYESAFLFRYADAQNTDEWRYNVFRMFISYLYGNISNILELIEKDVAKYVDEELETLSCIDKEIVRLTANGIALCIYMKVKHIPSSSIIGNALLSKCDVAIIINESLRSISFRSSRCNVREIAKLLDGGGHVRAAGAPLNVSSIYRVLRSMGVGDSIIKTNIVNSIVKRITESGIDWGNLCNSL